MLVNLLLATIAVKIKVLTLKGTFMAFVFGVLVYYMCFESYIVVFLYFFTILAVERFVLKDDKEERQVRQVLCNYIFAFVAVILYVLLKKHRYFVLYCSMLSVSMAGTIASTIGSRFAKRVYSITNFKQVTRGVSGGVSLCGSVFGGLGSIVMALTYFAICIAFFEIASCVVIKNVFVIIVLGWIGMVIDSVLGDAFQKKYYCAVCDNSTDREVCCGSVNEPIGVNILSNNQVNLISEGLVFVLGLLIMWDW